MKKTLATLAFAGTIALGGATGVVPVPTVSMDESTGYVTVPVFDTPSGELEDGQYTILEDGVSVAVRIGDYVGPPPEGIKGMKRATILSHKNIGTFKDIDGLSYLTDISTESAEKISRGEKETRVGVKLRSLSHAEAAIAYTASKTFTGRNLVTSSTTDITVSSGDTAIAYGGFNNNGTATNMSLSCTSGTVIKANNGVEGTGTGAANFWAIANPSVGTNTCTLTASSSIFMLAQVDSLSGTVTDTTLLESQATGSCAATTSCSTAVTIANTGAWAIGFSANSAGTPGVGAGTTLRVSDANGIGLADSNAALTAGSNSLIFTRPANANFATNIMGFKAAPVAASVDSGSVIIME